MYLFNKIPSHSLSALERFHKTLKGECIRPKTHASKIGWRETTHRLKNGNLDYVEPVRSGCYIHWEVNPQGIIVGFQTEGNRCD